MQHQLYPTDLTDRQGQWIMPLIPPAKAGGRPRSVDLRQVINAILYLVVTGCQWRMLPKDYLKWQPVYHDFRPWRDDGTWQRMPDPLRAAVRRRAGRHKHPTAGALASQSVKTTQIPGLRGDAQGKQVNGRTRHLVVDTLGLRLAVVVTAASTSDPAGARLRLARLGGACKTLRKIWVDGTYRGKVVDWVAEHGQFLLQPVLRSDDMKGFGVLPWRWVVERTFAWLTHWRRLSKDYEVLPASSEAMISIAMTRLMLHRLVPA
jgi:putative transposase